jgi:predicted phosphate transport protein (TIGR00153 family)
MFSLTPKEDKFYDYFIEIAKIAQRASNMLVEFIQDLDNSEENHKKLKEIEHEGDKKQHEILQELNKTFITPFDREDIYLIAKDMDDVIDLIEATASRFVMLNVNNCTEEAEMLSRMIVSSCEELINLMEELKNMKTSKKLSNNIIEINRIEEEGDRVSRKAIMDLFRSNTEVIEIIKWREIYQYLEDTLDACEDVANVVEGVVMKNA